MSCTSSCSGPGDLRLSGSVYGVRYPSGARGAGGGRPVLSRLAGQPRAPEAFARHRLTVHVPRRAYVRELPGIPTIRVFEALACGIPLICAPWEDREGLFAPGHDYLTRATARRCEATCAGCWTIRRPPPRWLRAA